VCVINYELPPQISRVERFPSEPINGVLIGGSTDTVYDPSLLEAFPEMTYYAILNHRVEVLQKEAMTELATLEGFDLSNGDLTRIEFDAFLDMVKLRDIDLSKNKLVFIHPQLFTTLANLEKLNLNGNQLQALEVDTFTNNKKLQVLKLQNNKISYISPRALEGVYNLRELYFTGNPCINVDYKPPRIPQLRFVFAQQCKESNEVLEMLSEKRVEAEGFENNYEDFQEENE
jgi:Leucine-rich repeat (LRR) protein